MGITATSLPGVFDETSSGPFEHADRGSALSESLSLDERTDLSLIARLQNGDDSALDEIMEHYKEALFAFSFRFVSNQADAADIVEETFVKLYLNRNQYKPSAKFSTWIYTIATNLCRDWARRRSRKPATPVAEFYEGRIVEGVERDHLLPNASSTMNVVQEEEEASILRNAIDSLPGDLKAAVILFCLESHSQTETATLLGCSAKAVEARVYRAKKLLRKRLDAVIDR